MVMAEQLELCFTGLYFDLATGYLNMSLSSKIIQEKRSAYDTAFIYTETDDFDLTYFCLQSSGSN